MTAAPLLVGCALHDGADIDACGCPALDSPGAIAYRGLLVKARAEIARLTAELVTAEERHEQLCEAARGVPALCAELERTLAELAAARAVPADVEAAIVALASSSYSVDMRANLRCAIARAISDAAAAGRREVLDRAKVLAMGADVRGKTAVEAAILTYRNAVAEWEHDDPISGSGKDAERRQCDAYIALLAAISDATAAAVTEFIDGHAKRLCESLGESWDVERTKPGCWPAAVREVLDMLVATPGGLIIDGRSRQAERAAARGTVGGLLATGTVRQLLGGVTVVEWYLATDWYQARIAQRATGTVAGAEMRWRHENARSWSSWGQPWGDPAQHMDKPARLVPAAEADADPNQRGPLPKGG